MSVISGLRMEAAFPASFPVCEHCPRSSCGFGGKTAFSHLQELLGQELSLGAALDLRLSCLKHLRLQPGVRTGLNPKHASRVLRGLAKQSQVGFGTIFFCCCCCSFPRLVAIPALQLSQIPGCQWNNGGFSGDLARLGSQILLPWQRPSRLSAALPHPEPGQRVRGCSALRTREVPGRGGKNPPCSLSSK